MSSPTVSSSLLAVAKRPYVTPVLVVHGDVQTLTQNQDGLPDDQLGASVVYYVGQ